MQGWHAAYCTLFLGPEMDTILTVPMLGLSRDVLESASCMALGRLVIPFSTQRAGFYFDAQSPRLLVCRRAVWKGQQKLLTSLAAWDEVEYESG